MDDVTQFVIRHANLVLFAAVFADQVGLPFPSVPVLLGKHRGKEDEVCMADHE